MNGPSRHIEERSQIKDNIALRLVEDFDKFVNYLKTKHPDLIEEYFQNFPERMNDPNRIYEDFYHLGLTVSAQYPIIIDNLFTEYYMKPIARYRAALASESARLLTPNR